MKFWVGFTDYQWVTYLSQEKREDINFWQPTGNTRFGAVDVGAPFLFKLKKPMDAICGVAFFAAHSFLPASLAWDSFGERNGTDTYERFLSEINRYRVKLGHSAQANPMIGCIILTNPVFFRKEDWIPTPTDWRPGIVRGKAYSTNDPTGATLWQAVQERLARYHFFEKADAQNQFIVEESGTPEYRTQVLAKVRVGQGAFRVMVTDAYGRRCAITGERTMPVLEAAHIRPFAHTGPNLISNGLLLRSDLHKLFDSGYLTITPEKIIEVSGRIKEEFDNGKEYYKHHGKPLLITPKQLHDGPSTQFLTYHNTNIYKG
jgi:putative restriction endonuclease